MCCLLFATVFLCVVGVNTQGDYFKSRQMIHPGMPGPWVKQTHGEVWPKPQMVKPAGRNFSVVEVNQFLFRLDSFSSSCDILQEAINRYYVRTFPKRRNAKTFDSNHPAFLQVTAEKEFRGVIKEVEIVMKNNKGCEKYPHFQMDEHYEIKVDSPDEPHRARIIAFSVWGILRGLETFSQLVHIDDDRAGVYRLNSQQVMDFPRFSWRGILLDSSRHFLSKRVIYDNLDLMEINKFNVFHWHIVDDNSFPYESLSFPNMSIFGAYRPHTHVYSQEDIREIIEYARLRGIRVVPEFDTPGHTESWEAGHPGLLTSCYHGSTPSGLKGPMDPTKDQVYSFLHKFFKEVTTVFPDKYLHLGGDEVDLECWQSNPNIKKIVQEKFGGNFKELESYFVQKLLKIIESYPTNNGYIVWQEIFDNGDKVKNDTVIEVWKGNDHVWGQTMAKITQSGLRAILSAPWYLNYISYGADWVKYYTVDPQNFQGNDKQKNLVMGGEACIWGEFVNSVNLIPRLWPRASAIGERLWSSAKTRDVQEAAKRLQEHECRMLQRGYPVEPANGAGFCDVLWQN